jgi:hypothetical protein
MLFKYKIRLEVEVEFDAPLLGTDTTKSRRGQTDAIAKAALAEMIRLKPTSYVGLDREIKEDNLNGSVKGEITLRTAEMHKRDQDAVKET